ncbi:MAG: PKD domain-containing protein [Thermoanaerobaculia bacterium]|nr:PKD domain-containing protein [Thermoanaerobaculia bacterium]
MAGTGWVFQGSTTIVFGLGLALGAAAGAQPAVCIDGNQGASAPPAALWGELQPGVPGRLPASRDSTNYTGQQLPDALYPNFSSLDLENGWVFVSYSLGVQIWDARGVREADPVLMAERDAKRCGDFLEPPFTCGRDGTGEARWSVWDIDAPEGKDDVVAAFGRAPLGVTIWNSAQKSNLEPKYQDTAANFYAGWAVTIGGRDYAFAAADGTNGLDGLVVYDLTTAKNLVTPCLENSAVTTACGVRRNRFAPGAPAFYVDGFRHGDGRTFLVHSGRVSARGLELWDVSDPAAPTNLRAGGGRFLASRIVHGVALWQEGSRSFLAAWFFEPKANEYAAELFDLTSCLTPVGCRELPAPLATLHRVGPVADEYFVTFSRGTGGTPYLYFGHQGKCLTGRQTEWLYDVSPLAIGGAPHEITPDQTITAVTATEGPTQVDYWSYAYAQNPGGYSQVMPRVGKFQGDLFYRAAWTLFDTHRRVAPRLDIAGPATASTGQHRRFVASATHCLPGATGWTWTATGGASGGGSGPEATFDWPAAGTFTVTARHPACSTGLGSKSVTVKAAASVPLLAEFAAEDCGGSPCTVPVGTAVEFTDFSAGIVASSSFAYDWNHTGASEATCRFGFGSTEPAAAHVFLTAGAWTPCLRVTRGAAESDDFVSAPIIVTGVSLPSLALNGPGAARTGQAVTLTALAEGCAPGTAGWVWTAPGAVFDGPADRSSVQLRWPTAGSRVVAVAHPQCPGALASRPVTVTGSSSAALTAEFHYRTTAPLTLAFEGALSTGAGRFTWTFPGGVRKSGPSVLHRFATAGTFPVTLEVQAADCGAPPCPLSTVTRSVRVE